MILKSAFYIGGLATAELLYMRMTTSYNYYSVIDVTFDTEIVCIHIHMWNL